MDQVFLFPRNEKKIQEKMVFEETKTGLRIALLFSWVSRFPNQKLVPIHTSLALLTIVY